VRYFAYVYIVFISHKVFLNSLQFLANDIFQVKIESLWFLDSTLPYPKPTPGTTTNYHWTLYMERAYYFILLY